MSRSPHALKECCNRPRRADLNHQIHFADIDPQLQRRGGHQRRQRPILQPRLGVQPSLAGKAAVMAGDFLLPQQSRQPRRQPLGELARVHEYQRRAVAVDQPPDHRVNFVPLLMRADRRQRRRRHFNGDVHLPPMPYVHQLAFPPGSHQKSPHFVQRLLRGRQSNALDLPRQRLQPFQ